MQVLQYQQKLFFAFLLNASLEIIALRQTKPLRYLCRMHKNNFFCGLETLKIIALVTQILLKKKCFLNLPHWAKWIYFFCKTHKYRKFLLFSAKKMTRLESYCIVDAACLWWVLYCKTLIGAHSEWCSARKNFNWTWQAFEVL